MSDARILIEEIRKLRQALGRIEAFYDRSAAGIQSHGRTPEAAIVTADLLAKHYTCLETLFLRISQFFENSLADGRWHTDLLEKMTLSIPGVRQAVIRDGTRTLLLEMLKFRHFTRYYFDIAYDWDRLDYLRVKFAELRPVLCEDLDAFLGFLEKLQSDL